MEPWEPYRPSGSLPGNESKWAEYWASRVPYDRAVHYLQAGRVDYLDDALVFLDTRPRYLQSGYLAEKMLRYLSRPALSVRQRARVVAAAERIANEGYTREAWEAKKLLVRLGVPGRTAVHTRHTAEGNNRRIVERLAKRGIVGPSS